MDGLTNASDHGLVGRLLVVCFHAPPITIFSDNVKTVVDTAMIVIYKIDTLVRQPTETGVIHMNHLRYVIEAKDQSGWFDYAKHSNLDEAKRHLSDLKESFGVNLRLIDLQNMIEVSE